MAGDPDRYDDEPSRSIFSRLWFRALLVVVVLGVVAAVAVPYVLDMLASRPTTARAPAPTMTPAPRAPVTTPAPTTPAPTSPAPTSPALPPGTSAPAPAVQPVQPGAPKPTETTRPAPAPATKPDAAARSAAARPANKPATTRTRTAASGPYWVQVGAFRDAASAKRLAERLRGDNFRVEESLKPGAGSAPAPAASPGADRYNVFVSGSTPAEVNAKLADKGLSADAVAGGVVVRPTLPLRDAVQLSRDLAGEGFRVQVRRATGPSAPAPAAASSGETWHRVRVGSFPDRASATAALKQLEAKGYKAYLARGTQ